MGVILLRSYNQFTKKIKSESRISYLADVDPKSFQILSLLQKSSTIDIKYI